MQSVDKRENRFQTLWDLDGFAVALEVRKVHQCTGWKYMAGVDVGFLSMWIYFGRIRTKQHT